MSVKVREIATNVVALSSRDWGLELVSQWISRRYQELAGQAQFRHLRKVAALYLPAPINTGTFTVTLGSRQIVADANATAAMAAYPGAPNSIIGNYWRLGQGSVWYQIMSIDTAGSTWTLTVETPYASDNTGTSIFGNSNTLSGLSFYIIQRYTPLAPQARQLGTFVIPAMFRPLTMKSEDELNMLYSNRFLVAYPPRDYAIVNSNLGLQGQPKVAEFYPYPQASTTIFYVYWATPPALGLEDYIPDVIDRDILLSGALAYSHQNAASAWLKTGNVEAANTCRNWANQEETKFQSKLGRAIRNDRGVDDLKFVLLRYRQKVPLDFDPLTTAAEDWYARGGISA